MQLVTLDRLADHRQGGDRVRRLAGRVPASLPPAPSPCLPTEASRFEPQRTARSAFRTTKSRRPRSRSRSRSNKFAPGPLAPRAGPGCVPARPARRRGARPPPTSPRGAAPGRPGRPPTKLLYYYHITVPPLHTDQPLVCAVLLCMLGTRRSLRPLLAPQARGMFLENIVNRACHACQCTQVVHVLM